MKIILEHVGNPKRGIEQVAAELLSAAGASIYDVDLVLTSMVGLLFGQTIDTDDLDELRILHRRIEALVREVEEGLLIDEANNVTDPERN